MSLPGIGHILLAQQQKRRDSFTSVVDMDLHTLLNTNRAAAAGGFAHRNMQYEVPLPIAMNHDVSTSNGHYAQNLYVPNGNNRIKSENGSERGVSPHTSEHSSRYSSQTPQNSVAYQQIAAQLTNGMRYPSPNQMQQNNNMPMLQHSYHPNTTQDQGYQTQAGATMGAVQQAVPQSTDQTAMDGGRASTGSSGLPKAFACSTCQKGFARRSDLARHGTTFLVSSLCTTILTRDARTNPLWCSTARLRPSWLWQAVHPAFRLDCSFSRAHWREATYV